MQRDNRDRLESFSAREDDQVDPDPFYRASHSARAPRQGQNLALQIALGIWLGGLALGLSAWALNLLLAKFGLPVLSLP
ncbi:MAG: hypothetical protein ABWY06_22210 [Pseudomonas sp.]|uniref:hypothetical protein n=1 Tax=Pseudomonas sp. TaxID=306 RepID=UPI003392B8E0